MESLSGDVIGLVLERVANGDDRKSCSEVSAQWFTIEALTRTRVCVHDPERLPYCLFRFPNLTTLVVDVEISDEALVFVAVCCPKLQTLDLTYLASGPRDDGLVAVARGCRRLVDVSLSATNVGDRGIGALQMYAKDLAVLYLAVCDSLTDTSLAAIGYMESVSKLDFVECSSITDDGLNFLSIGPASRSLRFLGFSTCEQITDVGVLYLRRMSRLEGLNISCCYEVTDVGGVALSALSSLKRLDLSCQVTISDETLFAVAKGCRNLVDINLFGCQGITGRGIVSLASSLPLERIDMSHLEECRELSPYHVMQIAERCHSLRNLLVDEELEEGLSPSQREKLRELCCVDLIPAWI